MDKEWLEIAKQVAAAIWDEIVMPLSSGVYKLATFLLREFPEATIVGIVSIAAFAAFQSQRRKGHHAKKFLLDEKNKRITRLGVVYAILAFVALIILGSYADFQKRNANAAEFKSPPGEEEEIARRVLEEK